jgi:Tfp pilus assembly protein PilX
MKKNLPNRQRGAALIIVVFFFITISLAIIQSATTGAISELRTYRSLATSKFAYVAAEAGIEDVFYRIINDKNVPASETITLNGATSTVTVVLVSDTEKDIYATGNTDSQYRKLYMKTTKNKSVPLSNGAQIGEGGSTMKQGAKIDGLDLAKGDVYSDGQIKGVNGQEPTITGNAISSSGIVEDQIASSTACTNDGIVGKTNPNIDFAQSFQLSATSSSAQLKKVSLYIKRDGNATGANIRITADSAGHPATTALATQALPYALAASTYGWVSVSFASPATLDPGVTYWIVLDSTQDNSKYWYWCRSNTDTYATGTPVYKQDWTSALAWNAVSGDLAFKTTFGAGISQIIDMKVTGIAKADTITTSQVTGDAYYQTISGSTVAGTAYPGSPTPPYVALPLSSSTINQWKTDAASGGITTGNCGTGGVEGCNTFPLQLGARRINGNLSIAGGEVLTVNGTIYVTGDIEIGAGGGVGTVKCAFAFLGNSCVIIADGFIRMRGGSILDGSGAAGSFLMMLSTKKGCLGSGGTGCTTNDSAIALENSVDGALFYTTDSLIDISNNAILTAVVGYMLQMQNGTTINYDASLVNLSFAPSATTTTGAWNVTRWNEF